MIDYHDECLLASMASSTARTGQPAAGAHIQHHAHNDRDRQQAKRPSAAEASATTGSTTNATHVRHQHPHEHRPDGPRTSGDATTAADDGSCAGACADSATTGLYKFLAWFSGELLPDGREGCLGVK